MMIHITSLYLSMTYVLMFSYAYERIWQGLYSNSFRIKNSERPSQINSLDSCHP